MARMTNFNARRIARTEQRVEHLKKIIRRPMYFSDILENVNYGKSTLRYVLMYMHRNEIIRHRYGVYSPK